ncbi:MAG TPA: hypothetical protein VJB57_08645 [Dehalococcoidia bacterium]|nr:hypothetical protein [Dehalococcoidia bacterium]
MEKALIGVGALSAAAIATSAGVALSNEASPDSTSTEAGSPDHTSHAATAETNAAAGGSTSAPTAEETNAHHKQGIDDFLKNQTLRCNGKTGKWEEVLRVFGGGSPRVNGAVADGPILVATH